MTNEHTFYTRTMAKVLERQGDLKKAADIYQYLLKKEPHSQDIPDKLNNVNAATSEKRLAKVVCLFNRWFELADTCNHLKKLIKIREQVSEIGYQGSGPGGQCC
jgi:hypothetical protein